MKDLNWRDVIDKWQNEGMAINATEMDKLRDMNADDILACRAVNVHVDAVIRNATYSSETSTSSQNTTRDIHRHYNLKHQ